eukprot:1152524-Pelagomonas_calceolata.AAC.3
MGGIEAFPRIMPVSSAVGRHMCANLHLANDAALQKAPLILLLSFSFCNHSSEAATQSMHVHSCISPSPETLHQDCSTLRVQPPSIFPHPSRLTGLPSSSCIGKHTRAEAHGPNTFLVRLTAAKSGS